MRPEGRRPGRGRGSAPARRTRRRARAAHRRRRLHPGAAHGAAAKYLLRDGSSKRTRVMPMPGQDPSAFCGPITFKWSDGHETGYPAHFTRNRLPLHRYASEGLSAGAAQIPRPCPDDPRQGHRSASGNTRFRSSGATTTRRASIILRPCAAIARARRAEVPGRTPLPRGGSRPQRNGQQRARRAVGEVTTTSSTAVETASTWRARASPAYPQDRLGDRPRRERARGLVPVEVRVPKAPRSP